MKQFPPYKENIVGYEGIEILSQDKHVSMAEEWFELIDEKHFWLQWRLRVVLKFCKQINVPLDKNLHALEIGVGCGILRTQLESATQWSIDGADLNKEALARCKKGRGRIFLYNVLEKNSELSNRYDLIILFDVIEHIKKTKEFIDSIVYHLRNGGLLLVNAPALQSCYSNYDQAIGHFRRYDKKAIVQELEQSALKILDTTYWGMSMLPLLGLRKLFQLGQGSTKKTIAYGMMPPSALIDRVLKGIMYVETTLFGRCPLGTSILVAAKRTSV